MNTQEPLRIFHLGYKQPVIHGGVNSLRFTPHFQITATEVDLMIDGVKQALLHGPRLQAGEREAVAA